MKKGITIVFIANIVSMIFSVITSFILPKYLSIESFGQYKIFQLYLGYLGILHLGYADGIYLRYGGESISSLDRNELLNTTATIRNMQVMICVVAAFFSFYFGNPIAFLLSLSCVPVNMISYYKNLYQATGEFKNYGTILTALPLIMFVGNVILLLLFKVDWYVAYILVAFFSNLFIYVMLEVRSFKRFGGIRLFTFKWNLFRQNISSGITLTIGNFASIMITSLDRWCIQMWMSLSDFSFYSFAVSVENLFNICVSAITTTLYNYLCRIKERKKIVLLKSYCVFIGIYLVSVAFPVKFIVLHWLIKYQSSISCLFILIAAHLFYFVIKAIYVNLYKAEGRQKHYLHQMLIVLMIAAMANLIAYFCVSKTKEAFAVATLLTAVFWFFICYLEFKDIRGKLQEIIVLLSSAGIFLLCGLAIKNEIIGCFIYVLSVSGLALCFCKESFSMFIDTSIDYVKRFIIKK